MQVEDILNSKEVEELVLIKRNDMENIKREKEIRDLELSSDYQDRGEGLKLRIEQDLMGEQR